MNEVPLIPVYLVPKKESLWKKLADLLTETVADFLDLEWIETACARLTIPDNFTSRWCATLKEAGVYRPCPKNDISHRRPSAREVGPDEEDDGDFDMENETQGGG
jgi:hypothetical protein